MANSSSYFSSVSLYDNDASASCNDPIIDHSGQTHLQEPYSAFDSATSLQRPAETITLLPDDADQGGNYLNNDYAEERPLRSHDIPGHFGSFG